MHALFANTLFSAYILLTSTCLSANLTEPKLPPCKRCKEFVHSLKDATEKTNSLQDIWKEICSKVQDCEALKGEYSSALEDWWTGHSAADLQSYMCVEKLRLCCPEDHFGPNCTPCTGFPDNICTGNGRCKGAGTRKGNGQCKCDPGYQGEACDSCSVGYYEAYKDDKKLLCSECHPACEGGCSKSGPKGCKNCARGWIADTEKGCLDVNECASPKSPCSPLQFCVNSDGSYSCLECDRSCAGCTGDGPDMCLRCASGYVLKDNMCTDAEHEDRQRYVQITRYCTYFGLCIATCIIFQKNVAMAAVIGLGVGVYISMSEYILSTPPTPNTDDLAKKIAEAGIF